MRRKIAIHVLIDGERERSAVWVDEEATDEERKDAVDEVVADNAAWYPDSEVELDGWGETGTVMEDGWAAEPHTEQGW
jgi:hypothetical protein